MDNAFSRLISQYADDLEELLQCPVCFNNLVGSVPLCVNGHHICILCKGRLNVCPYCQCEFNGSRNYLAENLMLKFNEIKVSLVDPNLCLNNQITENVTCVATQTDVELLDANDNAMDISNEKSINPPVMGKGKFPCKIGDCTEELAHGRMIPHIRYYHKENLMEEKIEDRSIYSKTWLLPYNIPYTFDQAISIPVMGIFFFNVTINNEGNLHGQLQIVNTQVIAKEFHYVLEVGTVQNSVCYKGTVVSCRLSKKKVDEKFLFVNSSFMKNLIKKKDTFKCTLTLTRTSDNS